ncbi:hypothetical protein PRIPAC_92271 [Pristionchus pacificus]|uniref:Smr domain-containing protein n=1 Tax=Pristionchus pacificus TaxID=54126 RepID=A0A2A6BBA6_PRIPA|nr:hypothetical protein PRIPAC_92271 [Pristionchus pacificus]|eukprot:PDM63158.1 hypothetical protein PRIPAC_50373 [Pristionchus pacificus]
MTHIISRPPAFSQHEPRLNGFESSHSSCSPPYFGSRSPYCSDSPPTSKSNRFNEAAKPQAKFAAVVRIPSIPEKRHASIDLEMMRMKNKGGMSKSDYKTKMDAIYNSSTIASKDKHKQMIAVNEKWNSSLDANVIDVHSLHQQHIAIVLAKNIKVIRGLNWNCLYVVTGVGNGSPGKVPVLKRRVQDFAAKNGYG